MSLALRKTTGFLRLLLQPQTEVIKSLPPGGAQCPATQLPRGRCQLTLSIPEPATFSGGLLSVRWAGGGIQQLAFKAELAAKQGWFACEMVLPPIADQIEYRLHQQEGDAQTLLMQWVPARRWAQLSLLLRGVLRRLPAPLRALAQRVWIGRLQKRKPRHRWGWAEVTALGELDCQAMRQHCQQEGWDRRRLRVWVDGREAGAEAIDATLHTLRQNAVDIFALGVLGELPTGHSELVQADCLEQAVEASGEEWLAVLPAGARVAPAAGYWLARALNEAATVVYTDAHDADGWPEQSGMLLAGGFDPELFREQGMLPGFVCIRTSSIRQPAGSSETSPGAGSWPQLVQAVVAQSAVANVLHIDQVLLSYPAGFSHRLFASAASYKVAEGWERVPTPAGQSSLRPRLHEPLPSVAVVIPTRDRVDLLRMCIGSLQKITRGVELEICVADNDSAESETHEYFSELRAQGAQIVPCPGAFNFSRIVNHAVAATQADYVLLLNNDIEITEPDWLLEMLAHAQRPEVGCVGAKLFFPDGRIQHAGVTIGLGGLAGHPMRFYPGDSPGYMNRLDLVQSYRAVTAACLLVRRSIYEEVGGLNEPDLAVAYNDVDFCLRVERAGYRNIWTPHARLVHHEYASRGLDTDPVKAARYAGECEYLRRHWNTAAQVDPYYPRLLTRADETCSLVDEPWGPRPWLVTICRDE